MAASSLWESHPPTLSRSSMCYNMAFYLCHMPERSGRDTDNPPLPEPDSIIEGIARELQLDTLKKPSLFEGVPEEQLFPEEAPTLEGRYLAGVCLDEIYNLGLTYATHTPPGQPLLLTPRDVRWL